MTKLSKIIYTKTDEAPALATSSFLPILRAFVSKANIDVELRDISLVGRIIANFPEYLKPEQRISDDLKYLGELTQNPDANIIKLPNISASIPQLEGAIKELNEKGYAVPQYPKEVTNEQEKEIKTRYAKVLGSAVNPVLREGNSDRRVADAVKEFAKNNPHSMGDWKSDSKSNIAHMDEGDFYSSEKSFVAKSSTDVSIELHTDKGEVIVLKESTPLLEGEIIDGSKMSKKSLCDFYAKQIERAKQEDVLLSLHLKATMMKVSDPIMFGHAVRVFFADVFEKYSDEFKQIGINANNGLGDVYSKITQLSTEKQEEIKEDISNTFKNRPELAMVNSDKGITNLNVPSDVIIDASMPAAIRTSGKMWDKNGELKDTLAMIPDRCYAGIYQEVFDFCKKNGAFDVTTMGNVCNVGLMAQKAEEYGSHDKTFEIPEDGVVKVVCSDGTLAFEHKVEAGDIWRMCQTKDLPVRDWVKLAVTRATNTGSPAIFWLDENRAHDKNVKEKVEKYLKDYDLTFLDIQIKNPIDAMKYTLERVKRGENTISVTGNVLRDYLTDLFPIMELGTSAKMLSIVPLLCGGGLYETGAGGSAPKHVQQFNQEGHLRWDSIGEFLAIAVSLEDLARKHDNKKAMVMAKALNKANSMFLLNNRAPSRKVNELDNRGSQFYLTMYWAQALAEQEEDFLLQEQFALLAEKLEYNQDAILKELIEAQGKPMDIGGYYFPDETLKEKAMRPSEMFNKAISEL